MQKVILVSVCAVLLAASSASGLRIDPNDDLFLWVGAGNTNFDASRLAVTAPTKALTILEFDIPADAPAADTFLHIFGGVDPDLPWPSPSSMSISAKVTPYDFDETTETWNGAGWMGSVPWTGVGSPVTILNTDTTFQWWTWPLADAINAGMAGQRVVFWLNADSGPINRWSVFEDKEGSALATHGPGFGGPGFGPWVEVIPEPNTLLLLILAGVPLLGRRGKA
jgi:hypothetical protein